MGLYRAGERQLKFAKETTANQAAQISDQIKVARQSADAATKAADVGEKSLRAAERAYLGLERVDLDGFYIGNRPRIASKIVNSGRTHGTIIEFAHTISVAENIPEIPSYDRIVHDQFLVRPGGEVSVLHFIGNDALTTETHRAVILGEKSIFYWGKVTYRTEFDEIYELGFATQIVLEALGERERWGINAPQNRSSYFFNRRKELLVSLLKNPHALARVSQFSDHELAEAGTRGGICGLAPGYFLYIAPEARVPANHPLTKIRILVRDVLGELNRRLGKLYASVGRPSIPPEQLLTALLLQVFNIRWER